MQPSHNSTTSYIHIFSFLLLALSVWMSYSGTLHSSWQFDDMPNIVNNEKVQISSFTWEEIKKTFHAHGSGKITRAASFFSFALNYLMTGKDPVSYHITNITIHIVCAFFVYLVFLQILEILHPGWRCRFFSLRDIALLGAWLWAMHPIHTQAVTYIVQRMASMAAMFYMIAFYCYLHFRRNPKSLQGTIFLLAGLVFWIIALFSKENTVLLPFVIFVSEVAFFQLSSQKIRKYFLYTLVIVVVVSLCAFLAMRGNVVSYTEYLYRDRPFTMWERLITEPIILFRYLGLLLYPIADFLSLESDIVASRGLLDPPVTLLANISSLALISLGIGYLRKYPLLCFAVLFFFINHLVESSFIGLELYFEHRNYLPSMFLYLVVAFYFAKACNYYLTRSKLFMSGVLLVAGTVTLMSEGSATYLRNDVWETEFSLLTEVAAKNPYNIRPIISLGAKSIARGKLDDALEYLKKSEKLYKQNPDRYQKEWGGLLYYNAGIIHLRRRNYEKAVQLLLKSAEFNDKSMETHANLAYLYYKLEDYENATKAFINAIQIRPDKSDLYNMFGRMLFDENKLDLAVDVLQNGIDVEPTREIQMNLVATYLRQGNVSKAKQVFYSIPYDNKDIIYLLYRLDLFGHDNPAVLQRIVQILISRKIDYCTWRNKIIKNDHPGLIYPERFASFEGDLRASYIKELAGRQEQIGKKIKSAERCDVQSEEIGDEG